jgi:hypothetical protein
LLSDTLAPRRDAAIAARHVGLIAVDPDVPPAVGLWDVELLRYLPRHRIVDPHVAGGIDDSRRTTGIGCGVVHTLCDLAGVVDKVGTKISPLANEVPTLFNHAVNLRVVILADTVRSDERVDD